MSGVPQDVAATQIRGMETPEIEVTVDGQQLTPEMKSSVTGILERLLGLRIDPEEFHRFAKGDARPGLLAERFRGLKPPCFPTAWKALLNGS